jgi:hypothetical protein
MVLLVDRSGLSAVVFWLSLVGGVAAVELVGLVVGGMLGSVDGGFLILLLCLGSVLCWAPTPLGVFWRCWCCGFGVLVGVPLGTGPRSDSALVAFEWGERQVVRELWEVISDEETCVCVLLTMLNQLMDAS